MHSIVQSFVDNEVFQIMYCSYSDCQWVDGSLFYFRQPAMKQELLVIMKLCLLLRPEISRGNEWKCDLMMNVRNANLDSPLCLFIPWFPFRISVFRHIHCTYIHNDVCSNMYLLCMIFMRVCITWWNHIWRQVGKTIQVHTSNWNSLSLYLFFFFFRVIVWFSRGR